MFIKWKKINDCLRNEQGFALVLVLILIVVMSVFALGVMGTTATSIKQSSVDHDHQGVYYIAEAGIALKMEQIKQTVYVLNEQLMEEMNEEIDEEEEPETFDPNIYFYLLENDPSFYNEIFDHDFQNNAIAEVDVIRTDDGSLDTTREYKIISKGKIDGKNRTVEQTFKVTFDKPSPSNSKKSIIGSEYVFHMNGEIDLNGSVTIEGDVATNLPESDNPIKEGNATISGEKKYEMKIAEMPPFPTDTVSKGNLQGFGFKKLQLDNNNIEYYETIKLGNNDRLQINIGDTYKELSVKKFILDHHKSKLEIEGNGLLIIYVDEELVINGSIYNVNNSINNDFAQVVFIFKGTYLNFNINQNQTDISAHIYAPNSTIGNNQNIHINGSITAKSIKLRGNSTIVYKPIDINKVPAKFIEENDNEETGSGDGLQIVTGSTKEL